MEKLYGAVAPPRDSHVGRRVSHRDDRRGVSGRQLGDLPPVIAPVESPEIAFSMPETAFLHAPAEAAASSQPVGGDEHRYRAILAAMLDPLTVCRPVRDSAGTVVDFIYTDVNPAGCRFIGLEREHLLGRRLLDLYPQVAATGLLARFAETACTGKPTIIENFPFPMRGIGIRWMDIRAVLADAWICFVWRDVSERHEAAEKISASEEQFRLLAENSLDVVVRIGADDRVLWVSPSVTPTLGWKPADCVGRPGIEFLATEASREQYRRDKAMVAAGQGVVSRAQIRNATGTNHWVEVHSSPYRTPEGDIDGVVATFRIIDSEVHVEQALDSRARIDALTQLLNRQEGLRQLEALVRRGGAAIGLLWCDIDRFKSINDVHGHAAGDAVLEALAARIRSHSCEARVIGVRLGGDELLVILDGVRDMRHAADVAEELRVRATEPIPVPHGRVSVTLSIGVTLARPGESVDDLLARADAAMYRAKEAGRDRVVAAEPPAAVGGDENP